ncbi:hypothetical protein [Maribacter sp. MAR_2009_72]|uniref:hypothetical protein n=1 Tax=Maribacter sp. MAR_2009_72 TaxID=1250050 RepID=UPI00119AEF1D|nr:hypothetical protein [Maribacter sp. MAR_2009_72]TVZ16803.1 hypothetical protein JM81_3074 [Maribacter sp. MAR_2009_72]
MKPYLILLLILITSCQSNQGFEEIQVSKPTMVSISPDSTVTKQLQEKMGDENYFVFIDDVMWYDSELMMLVDSFEIEQLSTEKRKIKLIGGNNNWQIDMDTTDIKWRYIYFDGSEFLESDAIAMKEFLSN